MDQFAPIKRKNSTTYRASCKDCEKQKANVRKLKKAHPDTDPAFFRDDIEGRMPSDSDLLFYSTEYYDILQESRKNLVNKTPKDQG